jgi:hypothetical protein
LPWEPKGGFMRIWSDKIAARRGGGIIIIIKRNGAKTISSQTSFGNLITRIAIAKQ